ncbi:hypothetical protein ATK17_1616 [Branchiibius hedensis]|uniref:Helix-turn-helix domain-containing protein n=1 Tax=Branchiibius hedensis TaxID=672460 RepID=A0A2Y9BTN5_9MICO|nr:hypothetical protein [Branchiibius hedensis]PWJ25489.1 hypothetical protein ATK17_1616 [Branchiibius hedensis]SSA34302.1 hypothetical protein SAMN04489750_1616 [Branchiibius hedensis]
MSTTVPTASSRRTMHNLDHLVEDIQWLLAAGESREMIVARLGYTTQASLARVLRRAGKHDLARPFERTLGVAR